MKCPVCNNESTNNVCPVCGYNLSTDLLNNRFVHKLDNQEVDEYKEQIRIHRKLYLKSIERKEVTIVQKDNKHYTPQQKDIAQKYFEKGTDYYAKKDYVSARECFEISAQNGKALSYFYLGLIYKYGLGVVKDLYKSFEYYNKAANLGVDIALKSVADMYFLGEGTPASLEKGLKTYEKAIDSTDHWALYELGKKYYYGAGVLKQDYTKARECFLRDTKRLQGVSLSYYNLAEIYEEGLGVPKNPALARQYRKKYDELTKRNG